MRGARNEKTLSKSISNRFNIFLKFKCMQDVVYVVKLRHTQVGQGYNYTKNGAQYQLKCNR